MKIRLILRPKLMVWFGLLATIIASGAALAQSEPAVGDREQLESLVDTLEDDARRAELVEHLKTLIEARGADAEEDAIAESAGAKAVAALSRGIASVGDQLDEAADALADAPASWRDLAESAGDPETRAKWLGLLGKLAAILAAGLIGRWLAHWLLAGSRERMAAQAGETMLAATVLFFGRALLALVPVAAFGAAAWLALLAGDPAPTTRVIGVSLINASVLVHLVLVATRLVVVPANGRSLLGLDGETAHYVLIWLRRLLVIGVFGYFFAEAALLLGLSGGAYAILLKLVGLIVAALLTVLILQNRRSVARALRAQGTGDRTTLASRLADIWHLPALFYVVIAFGTWALQADASFVFLGRATIATLVLVAVWVILTKALAVTFGRGLRLSDDLAARYPGLKARANTYFGILHRILRVLLLIVAVLILIEIWIGGSMAWLMGETGRALVGRLVTIVLVVAGALTLWEVVANVIERLLARTEGDHDGSRVARLRTLLPLIRNAARLVLGVIVVLTVLSEIGVDIAPLLAGAGIAGIAVGFGAQSLVKDVITGVFILLEDSIAVGDVVEVGGHAGVVESLTVRTVRLRDLNGNVHVVPFGEIATVLNMTKEFAFALIEAGVAYKEDTDQVVEVLQEIADGMQDDPDFGASILAPLEVLGLDSFGASSVNIRVRLKVRPGKQWGVRREFHRRLKYAFDARGIEIPFPHRTVFFGKEPDPNAVSQVKALPRSAARREPDADDPGGDI